jgi:zinc transport system substrate-binding protein
MIRLLTSLLSGALALAAPHAPPRNAAVSIPPLMGIAREVLPEGCEIVSLVKPGQSEHGVEYLPSDIAALSKADLIVHVGLGLEPALDHLLPKLREQGTGIVNFAESLGIKGDGSHDCSRHGHAHDHAHAHDHEDHAQSVDPHLWLDPVLVEKFVVALDASASGSNVLSERGKAAIERVRALDALYREKLQPYQGARIVTHHAAFGRLAERYGLEIVTSFRGVEGADPTPGDLARMSMHLRKSGVRAVFVEPQFDGSVPRRLAEHAGVPVGTLDPLGDGDWFGMMRTNLDELVRVLSADANPSRPQSP